MTMFAAHCRYRLHSTGAAPIRQGDIFQRLCYVEDALADINVDILLSWVTVQFSWATIDLWLIQ